MCPRYGSKLHQAMKFQLWGEWSLTYPGRSSCTNLFEIMLQIIVNYTFF